MNLEVRRYWLCAILLFSLTLHLTPICGSTLEWTGGGGDHSWHNPANWTPAGPPSSDDDILMGIAALNETITLTDTPGGTQVRGFTNTYPVTLKIENTSFRIQGEVEFAAGFELVATQSDVSVDKLTKLISGRASRSAFIMSEGSSLELKTLKEITGTGGRGWFFGALSGSRIDLPELIEADGVNGFLATGINSTIQLPGVSQFSNATETWNDNAGSYTGISTRNGGSITSPNLKRLKDCSLTRESGGYLNLNQLVSAIDSTVYLADTNIIFVSLSSLDGSDLTAAKGAILSFPSLTTWTAGSPKPKASGVLATGGGSSINFPSLASISDTRLSSDGSVNTYFQASRGGTILMPSLTKVFGVVTISAGDGFQDGGVNAVISCELLQEVSGLGGPTYQSQISASGGGKILAPQLRKVVWSSLTVNATLYPETDLTLNTLQSLDGSLLRSYARDYNLYSLTNANGSKFEAISGAILSLPSINEYVIDGSTGNSAVQGYIFRADGEGSEVFFPNLKAITVGRSQTTSEIEAINGGQIEAPILTSIFIAIDFPIGATGLKSKIQFPRLNSLSGGFLYSKNEGIVSLGQIAGGLLATGSKFVLYGGNESKADIYAPDIQLRSSTIEGSGHFVGNVTASGAARISAAFPNSSDIATPGSKLWLDGDLRLEAESTINLTLFPRETNPSLDQLLQIRISGKTTLQGGRVALQQQREIFLGEEYSMITWGTGEGRFFSGRGFDGRNGVELTPFYRPTDFLLLAEVAASPKVVNYSPVSATSELLDSLQVEFSEEVQIDLFSNVELHTPDGARLLVNMIPDPINSLNQRKYRVPIPLQNSVGIYRVIVPVVKDYAGFSSEVFTWSFELTGNPPPIGFLDWLQTKFSASEIANPLISGPRADPDNDGLTNQEEFGVFSNRGWDISPKVKDTDSDGFDDAAEVFAGTDPTKQTEAPALILHSEPAVEFAFATRVGARYRLERQNILTDKFEDFGAPIVGDGGVARVLLSIRASELKFFRLVEE